MVNIQQMAPLFEIKLLYLVILGCVVKVNGETSSGRLQPVPAISDSAATRLTTPASTHSINIHYERNKFILK